jgi:hypothetical protein
MMTIIPFRIVCKSSQWQEVRRRLYEWHGLELPTAEIIPFPTAKED